MGLKTLGLDKEKCKWVWLTAIMLVLWNWKQQDWCKIKANLCYRLRPFLTEEKCKTLSFSSAIFPFKLWPFRLWSPVCHPIVQIAFRYSPNTSCAHKKMKLQPRRCTSRFHCKEGLVYSAGRSALSGHFAAVELSLSSPDDCAEQALWIWPLFSNKPSKVSG